MFSSLRRNDKVAKFISFPRALHLHNYDRMRVSGELTSLFETTLGFRQGRLMLSFLMNFITGDALGNLQDVRIALINGGELCDLNHTDDFVCVRICGPRAACTTKTVAHLGMSFTPSKRNMLL